jgi:Flp pilus assembly pilin Flp
MRRLIRDEGGATAVIVAILLALLVGMSAVVVDLGDGMWERRMLQNSADAAALAVAIDCAQGDCGQYLETARSYASDNNWRGAYIADDAVFGLNGSPPTYADGEVTVVARTGDAGGEGRLRQWFAGVLGLFSGGADGETGLATGASATAIWGVPDLVQSASPLTISICAWSRLTGFEGFPPTEEQIDSLPTADDIAAMDPSGTGGQVIFYKDGPKQEELLDEGCKEHPGFYVDPESGEVEEDETVLPAAFGWLKSDDCQVTVSNEEDGTWAPAKSGVSPGGETKCVKDLAAQDPPVAVFPIFTGARPLQGTPDDYRIISPAAFYITGYRLPGGGPASYPASAPPCSASEGSCIRGYFVQALTVGPPGDGLNFGLSSVALRD